jgi:hypothetical protein
MNKRERKKKERGECIVSRKHRRFKFNEEK